MSLLEVKDLRTHFSMEGSTVKAVDGVDLSIEKGEIVGLVGESGSGKSVTCLSIMGLIPQPPGYFPTGEVWFKGKDLLKLSTKEIKKVRGDDISMIFQDPMSSLNPFLTVETQLTEVLEVHKNKTRREAKTIAIDILEKVGIANADKRIGQYPHQFSGGMRQRVMIAMALLCEPELLIADEPTTALDVTIQAQILELMKKLNSDFGTSIIFITHNMGVVAGMTDRMVVMYAGKMIEKANTHTIFEDPRHPYTHALLSSIPRLDKMDQGPLNPIPGQPPDLSDLPSGCPFHPRCSKGDQACTEAYPDKVQVGEDHMAACWKVDS